MLNDLENAKARLLKDSMNDQNWENDYWLSIIALMQGNKSLAIQHLKRSSENGLTLDKIQEQEIFQMIEKDPEFQAVVRSIKP